MNIHQKHSWAIFFFEFSPKTFTFFTRRQKMASVREMRVKNGWRMGEETGARVKKLSPKLSPELAGVGQADSGVEVKPIPVKYIIPEWGLRP